MKKSFSVACLIFLTISITLSGATKGIVIYDEGLHDTIESKFDGRVNDHSSYYEVLPQSTYAFLIGNNEYESDSGYSRLKYCINDIKIMHQIFTICCKFEEKNIFMCENLSYESFLSQFENFIKNMDKKSNVIFYFSGHGDTDGSLVFTDGKKCTPRKLKQMINAFANDTVLIIDACYSGKNDGPRDIPENEAFKSNCIRIYAALSHTAAKEIGYDNAFFKENLLFFNETLGLHDINGNGYFTALFGMFFSRYKLKKQENISYQDLVYYITNKGKIYVETLISSIDKGSWEEAAYKLDQYPKIYPVDERISFSNPSHAYLILQKPFVEQKIEAPPLLVVINTGVSIEMEPYNKVFASGIFPTLSLLYNLTNNWGIGISVGTQWAPTNSGIPDPFTLINYPVALHLRYCSALNNTFYYTVNAKAGIAITQFFYNSLPNELHFEPKFFWSAGIGIGFNLDRTYGISLTIDYNAMMPYMNAYHFISAGIELIIDL
ncbi:MAG: caspase family protein [Spirochaetales bacterium]|nr:caspase family protein [Spirochaetales bacterium]